MRLIDADRLKLVFGKNIGNPQAKAIFNQYVDMQPTVTDTNVGCKWIPASERLPKDGELVLLTFVGSKKVDMETAIYDVKDGFATAEMYVGLNEIIAWCPLPEPYKESDNE